MHVDVNDIHDGSDISAVYSRQYYKVPRYEDRIFPECNGWLFRDPADRTGKSPVIQKPCSPWCQCLGSRILWWEWSSIYQTQQTAVPKCRAPIWWWRPRKWHWGFCGSGEQHSACSATVMRTAYFTIVTCARHQGGGNEHSILSALKDDVHISIYLICIRNPFIRLIFTRLRIDMNCLAKCKTKKNSTQGRTVCLLCTQGSETVEHWIVNIFMLS